MTDLLRAELLKLRTTRTFTRLMVALAAVVVATVVVPVAVAPLHTGRFALTGDFAQRTLLSGGATAAGVFALILGGLGFAGEYRHGTVTPTFLVTPARRRVMGAKAITYTLAGCALGALTSLIGRAVTLLGLHARGVALVLSGPDLVEIVAGSIGYVGLAALLGLGVGAAVRDQVAALVGILVLFFIIENVLVGVIPTVARWLPGQAGSALAFPSGAGPGGQGLLGASVLPQSVGGVVFLAYALLATALGAAAAQRRDIT